MDFNRMNGVESCETSVMTNTLVLKYDSRNLDLADIKNVLQKWECHADNFSYKNIPSFNIDS